VRGLAPFRHPHGGRHPRCASGRSGRADRAGGRAGRRRRRGVDRRPRRHARFYDINALSNFVANPLDVLGWDPHERLVDFIVAAIEERNAK
jgi:hypothetical protein